VGQADESGRGRHSGPTTPSSHDTPPETPSTADSAPPPGRHRARGRLGRVRGTGRRTPSRLLLVAVVLSAVALAVAFTVTRSAPSEDADTTAGAASGRALVSWATAELPAGATLTVDPAVAAELAESGVESELLAPASSTSPQVDAPGLQVVPGGDLGDRTVIARFTDADGRLLAVVDPAAAPPDAAALDRRRTLGAALLGNPATMAPAPAAQLLRDGGVDARLLGLLAGLTARFGVQLADLPVVPGEAGLTPVRSAVLAAAGGRPLDEGTEQLDDVRAWLSAQRGPYAPDDVQLVDGGLLVGFRYVTDPDGAVTQAGG